MKQMTLSAGDFERHSKTTRRATFLAEMDRVVPWAALCALIEPVYPKAGNGRPPIGLERMLRIYFLQNWFNLSDPAVEEALYDSLSMRNFVGIDLGREGAPDETTVCKFRHLLEAHDMGKQLFEEVGRHLQANGMKVSTGTIVDASIINAPSSTKNREDKRDPEMCQTKKGNQWYFGMKAHIGVDSKTKLIHSVVATSANVHAKHPIPQLLHGHENRVYGDSAYASQKALIRQAAPKARDFANQKASRHKPLTEREREKNRSKSQVRAKVEHAFLVIKRVFGFAKVAYRRGLAKNGNRLFGVAALTNLFMARHHLFRVQGEP
ncbi:MAG: IS5 family transposase [Rhodocyclaceae bacterium]|nr:IS5 family transposase [Rhodocyclaceae bacterium]MCO5097817.1 IS5 family transposase [Rhodocyclaceae bacterium]